MLRALTEYLIAWANAARQYVFGLPAKYPYGLGALALLCLVWLACLPAPLFDRPVSAILEDRNGELLGARIAADGQWRFPAGDSISDKYVRCVVAFEDKRFWWHPGVDVFSMVRSIRQNLVTGKVVSGGSTLSMQVIRLARNNPPRTVWQKIVEIFMATRLEMRYSKRQILNLYASNAPFGGNVVGLEAASWRFFGKNPQNLGWAEAATLAVLPNSPALIHPGRNRNALAEKRNRLLATLRDQGQISAETCALAQEEPLPDAPLPLPQATPHLLDRLARYFQFRGYQPEYRASEPSSARNPNVYRFRTTIDRNLQERVNDILARRQQINRGNEVHNMAAVVIDVRSGDVLAYAGNVPNAGKEHGESVDVLVAPRSTGSILKPYLYALALESGDILPNSLLNDVPTQLGQYRPENFYETYDGAVPAKRALIRSLNVPFVLLLQQYGLEKFHFNLQRLGLSTLNKPPGHYGLSLILGGAEAKLIDIANSYACMARTLGAFYERNGRYDARDFRPPNILRQKGGARGDGVFANPGSGGKATAGANDLISAGAIWFAFDAMQAVERPNSSGEWELFQAAQQIAWKTGTSYGFRDAWAAGVTPRYAVGVWVGNADGEGRPGLLGVDMAAPALFDIFDQLPASPWFDPPYDDMVQAAICPQSGFRAGEYCPSDTAWIPKSGLKAGVCRYHHLLHLDASGAYQVNSSCEQPENMLHQAWFILPPIEEFYYKTRNPAYRTPPPFRADCLGDQQLPEYSPMQFIYPKSNVKIYVPVDLDGQLGKTVFQVAHRSPESEIFWHLDGVYLGSTKSFHQMALQPPVGKHTMTVVDKDGRRLDQAFEVIGK